MNGSGNEKEKTTANKTDESDMQEKEEEKEERWQRILDG